ncbi:sulfate transporter CysZ [Gilliamella apicola]|uniref:sulfate transporter CysZ n=1 Tax=Gilliamella apicola TaxID=1196095 RepID=UPI000A33D7D2|nr:sulfate transporter CysZ [Gilliamella apicola]OTQ27591.1 sulfate transporter CysZ [Gilliamella apicola]
MTSNQLDNNTQHRHSHTQSRHKNYQARNGFEYFFKGWSLAFSPGIKRFVFLPLLANIVLMSALFYWFFAILTGMVDWGLSYVPSWLNWLGYIMVFIIILILVILFCYFFSTVTNFIAAPFNGILAEQVEAQLTGMPAPDTTWISLIKDLPRILSRELQKLGHYLLWAIPILLTYFIPVIGQTVTPVVWFLFTAWQINIQYADYPFDNHKIKFHRMRALLKQNKVDNLMFGSLVSFFTMVPLLNLIVMPIAVCGATAMWVDRYRHQAVFESANQDFR